MYISKRLILMNRDVFAKNDKNSAICNANGVVIDTGNAKPQVYPLRPVLPNMRPIVDKHLDELLENGIIHRSESPRALQWWSFLNQSQGNIE